MIVKITMEADYAIRMVYCLAENGYKTDARTIAQEMGVQLRFALKILNKLTKQGITKSFKGATGGYLLNRPACEISLLEVVEAVDGPLSLNRCVDALHECAHLERHRECTIHQEFCRLSQLLRTEMEQVRFSDLVERGKRAKK